MTHLCLATEDDEVDNNYCVNYLTSAVGADGLEDGCGIWIQYCRYRGNNNTADGVR